MLQGLGDGGPEVLAARVVGHHVGGAQGLHQGAELHEAGDVLLGPLVASLEARGRLGHCADLDQALGAGLAFAFPAPRHEVVLAGLELGLPILQGLDLLI